MTITLQAVNELIASLESAGELSIKERKYLELAREFKQLAAESVGLKSFGDTLFDMYKGLEISGGGIHDEQSVVCQQAALDAAMSAFEEIETPATDRIYAGIKADGVEQAANECYGAGYICETLLAYAQQLREGAK
ncbi:TPA: hypothetical protein ACXP60_001081 [Klebsiella variicola subsp. variicola]|uniref:hypothetical protein n=1 Tax=Klebsiella variicola TaxID=244366 RepID=UPI0027FCC42B|nr:hypothetical protein [Raoultella ornithinolytica]HDU4292911.1 hypothetical protein [Klebsiella variicola]